MVEEIKNRIDKNKKDKKVYKEYIESFCESEKAKELFKNNREFKDLKKDKPVKEKEDEFF